MNLVIDQGNSTAKVVIFDDNTPVAHRRFEALRPEHIHEMTGGYPIDAAIYSSVSHHGEDIIVALRTMIKPGHVKELTSMLPLPIAIAYTTPSTLGRDRIAAVAGAHALFPGREILVVDAGTAVTYDRLTPDGTFAGGNIAPGLWMRAEALHTFTHRLPSVEVENPGSQVELWGTDTHSAIRSGVVRGVAAEVAYYRAMLTNPDNALVIITGGDARRVADMLPFDNNIVVDPLLVCKGLNSILKYNENL